MELAPRFHAVHGPTQASNPTELPSAPFVIRDGTCVLRCKGCCTLTSVMRQRGEIRQLPEDRHLRGDARVVQKPSDTQRPLSTECIAAVQQDDAADNYSLSCL